MGITEETLEVLKEMNRGIQFLCSQQPKAHLLQVCTIQECAQLLKMERSYLDTRIHEPGFPVYADAGRMRRLIPWEVLQWMNADTP